MSSTITTVAATKESCSVIKTSSKIWVTFAKHGMHCYPDAPDEVAYLRQPHRHLFQFKVTLGVVHDNRDVEFHMLQNWLMSLFDQGDLELDYQSCEMLARGLATKVGDRYPDRAITVEVSEDGECGAIIDVTPVHTF